MWEKAEGTIRVKSQVGSGTTVEFSVRKHTEASENI